MPKAASLLSDSYQVATRLLFKVEFWAPLMQNCPHLASNSVRQIGLSVSEQAAPFTMYHDLTGRYLISCWRGQTTLTLQRSELVWAPDWTLSLPVSDFRAWLSDPKIPIPRYLRSLVPKSIDGTLFGSIGAHSPRKQKDPPTMVSGIPHVLGLRSRN